MNLHSYALHRHYRQKLLVALNADLDEELEWTEEMIADNPKSYQLWHHRQVVIERHIAPLFPPGVTASTLTAISLTPYENMSAAQRAIRDTVQGELDFIAKALIEDSKNYHAWSYRQWVLNHFGKGPWWEDELTYLDELLTVDIRNNSAWNQRFFIVSQGSKGLTDEIVQREVQYVTIPCSP